ncbi:MFS transporter [Mycolicibacterium fortuitum]|nr:MFS transporter [Mycolicibacterium fortuitum]
MELTFGRKMLLATVCAVAVATIYAAQPVLTEIGDDMGMPAAELGWIVTAGQLGYLVGLAVLVPLGDVIDRRRLISAHLLLAGIAVALAATAREPGYCSPDWQWPACSPSSYRPRWPTPRRCPPPHNAAAPSAW